ncbi:RDD family protein [Ilumatobacter sp.]|uniref:RDD family protein n=1 Tax=Ilumatobacter sp. TaxID=1967498 RepID=UPI003B52CC01
MSDGATTPAGWYHAQGDADGTERYWDGERWVGEPRPAPSSASVTSPTSPGRGFAPPDASTAATPGGTGGGWTSGRGAGVQPSHRSPVAGRVPASWGQRAIAYLLDVAAVLVLAIVGAIVAAVGFAISDVLGAVLAVVLYLAVFAFQIWNLFVRQGRTGRSLGKEQRGIELVKDDTGGPVGGGMAFVRYLVAGLLSSVTCGVYGIVDVLWPLWDDDRKRLTDKILKMSVVESDPSR